MEARRERSARPGDHMAMNKKTKTALILGGLAVAAYLIYKWYENRQANNSTSSGTGQLGSNLNSTLTSLNAGPQTNVTTFYEGTSSQSTGSPITSSGTSTTGSSGGTTTPPPVTSGNGSSSGNGSNVLSWWTPAGGQQSGSAQQFLQAFQATGQDKGQIVPGGTGLPPTSG